MSLNWHPSVTDHDKLLVDIHSRYSDSEQFKSRIIACINACVGVSNEALQKWIDHLKRCGPGDAEHLEQFFDESDTW